MKWTCSCPRFLTASSGALTEVKTVQKGRSCAITSCLQFVTLPGAATPDQLVAEFTGRKLVSSEAICRVMIMCYVQTMQERSTSRAQRTLTWQSQAIHKEKF
jgi:hypothetical protein